MRKSWRVRVWDKELPALQLTLSEAVCCKSRGSGSIILKEDLSNQQGLYTRPYLFCEQCANKSRVKKSVTKSSEKREGIKASGEKREKGI